MKREREGAKEREGEKKKKVGEPRDDDKRERKQKFKKGDS